VAVLTSAVAVAAAPPAKVRSAVDKWTSTAKEIQDSKVLPTAQRAGDVVQHAQATCQRFAISRPGLADGVQLFANDIKLYVTQTERGELGLYQLAPQLGAKSSPARKAYVQRLDGAGQTLDGELLSVKHLREDAGLIGSGQCSRGIGDVKLDVGILTVHHDVLDGQLARLRAQFG
jgi:hypothetical protein